MISPVSGSSGANSQLPQAIDPYTQVLNDLDKYRDQIQMTPNFDGLSDTEMQNLADDMKNLCNTEGSQVKSFDFYFSSRENQEEISHALCGSDKSSAITMIDKLHGL